MANQSSVFPIYLRAEYRDDGAGFARFQSDAQRAAQAAKREFEGVRNALDQALSRPRNTGGSLDLGVDEMRQAALAQQQIAAAAREVANATKAAATANGAFDAAMSRSTRAAFELANAEERVSREMMEQVVALEAVQRELNQTASATNLVTEANRRGTTARGNVINSVRAERTAYTQLGQQLTDVGVQYQMGTNLLTIFTQQMPQAAFALTGLAESANRTQAAVGRFALVMAGPVGSAIVIATALMGPFIMKLFESGNEADKAKRKTTEFAAGLDIMSLSAENATSAMDGLIGRLQSAIKFQGDFIRGQIAIARNEAATLQAQIKADADELARIKRARSEEFGAGFLPTGLLPNSPNNPLSQASIRARELEKRLAENRAKLPPALEAAGVAAIAEANREIVESLDPIQKKINDVDDAIARLNQRRLETATRNDVLADGNISDADFKRQLGDLARQRNALEQQQRQAGGGGGGGGRSRGVSLRSSGSGPSEDQIARFQQQAAERVNQINDRFAEQTRLVTQSLQANREIDEIIAKTNAKMAEAKNLTEAQRKKFEGIIEAAASARDTIDAALVRPFEDLQRESDERLQIEQLLAQGRTDEAAALQIVLQLQRQIGTEAELRAALERAITEEKTTEVERIRNLLANYNDLMDATKQRVIDEQRITRELRDQQQVFNAQLDVLGTVRRDLTDILSGRGADFFGNFRQALQDLQGQRLFESIFGQTFRDIENELQANTPLGKANQAFAENVDMAAETTGRAETAIYGLADAAEFATRKLLGDFDKEFGAANDNAARNEIVVRAQRREEVGIARNSVNDLAGRISQGIGGSIGKQLEGLLGPKFATLFGEVAGGAIAGKVTGGTVGAVLGGATKLLESGILGNDNRISALFGKATEGAATGSQVNDISKLLGIKGSRTGSQIGGAIGGATGIPGGDIIGAIAGNIIGGMLKKTPRASATIGGVGGSLGLSSVTGTSGALRDSVGNLGTGVLDAVNRIASQLGATVNAAAGSVSIGQRKDNLRVDTSGRGITKIGNGAVDFGDDVEAAVAFAVRDLIQDGVITGLRQSEQNLLKAGKDVEAALADVLRFRSVFDQLDAIRDPVGSAVRKLNTEFESLIDLFEKAGASTEEFADLEDLYNIRRAEAIKEATDRVVGSLRSLLNDLTMGDNGLSLRDRRSNAVGQFDALAARVAAGDTAAFDDFADISQQLLDIERQLFGSTQSYFDRLQQVTALTEKTIADQTNVTSIAAGSPSPFADQANVARAIEASSAEQVGLLRAINDNIIALNPGVRPVGIGGSGGFDLPLPSLIQNF